MCYWNCSRKYFSIGELFEKFGVRYHAFEHAERYNQALSRDKALDYVEALQRPDRIDCPPHDKGVAYLVVGWDTAAEPRGLWQLVQSIQHDAACGCVGCHHGMERSLADYRERVERGESQIESVDLGELKLCSLNDVLFARNWKRLAKSSS